MKIIVDKKRLEIFRRANLVVESYITQRHKEPTLRLLRELNQLIVLVFGQSAQKCLNKLTLPVIYTKAAIISRITKIKFALTMSN